jgi:hypothetical protein
MKNFGGRVFMGFAGMVWMGLRRLGVGMGWKIFGVLIDVEILSGLYA